ncbi:hypothetical protein PILCRDRAFT_11178 [Piloderma croceum F 1598]|uniref:CHAT domain-containing protein n=1 Tax=Piloderma croceum (strain F 1598) TaxID=765440 RepID=A0A0C3FEY6_PILCF|nr:hypothetical protein PILCRDRAFT_11178 [Piloderma croceum F 1598]
MVLGKRRVLSSSQSPSSTQVYGLQIDSADVAAWVESLSDSEPRKFYVEIRASQMEVQVTEAAERNETLSWNEVLFLLIGNSSSIISLSILHKPSTAIITQETCIGCVDITFGTLLTRCADNDFAALEMMSVATESKEPTIGIIRVKLIECTDLNDLAMQMDNVGRNQLRRFWNFGNLTNLQDAFSNIENAVKLMDDECLSKPELLSNLGVAQQSRFEQFGHLSDLENAISNIKKAVDMTYDGHPDQPMYLLNLGSNQLIRFGCLGNLPDIENAISNIEKAVDMAYDGHPSKPGRLANLGMAQKARFECLGDLSDLENAISNTEKAIALAYDGHPDLPLYFSSLGCDQEWRFKHLGNLSDLENAISNKEKAVKLTDDGHPSKADYLSNLGTAQHSRFERLGNSSDLENAISNTEKAVMLTDDGHPSKPVYITNLGLVHLARFKHFGDLSDLEHAISNNEKAVDLTYDGHPSKPERLVNLGIAQQKRFEHLGILADLENAISNKEKAVQLANDEYPNKRTLLLDLGVSQQARFERLGNLSDLENAILTLVKAVELTDDGHPSKPEHLCALGCAQLARFERLGDLFDLEHAISNKEKGVNLTYDGDPSKSGRLCDLGVSQHTRFERLGNLFDLENAIRNIDKAVKLMDDRHPDKPILLSSLCTSKQTRFERLGDLSDLENAISSIAKAVGLIDDRHPNKPGLLINLGVAQRARFEHLGDLSDLENAISNAEKAVDLTDDGHPNKARFLSNLGTSHQIRFRKFTKLEDRVASVSSFKAAARLKAADPYHALFAARKWAEISHLHGDRISALEGYRTALELMPKVAWLGLDTPSRQNRLHREKLEDLGCLAASCAINIGHFEEAVELLDLGRSVFWNQAASLRSDLELLRDVVPELAAELEKIGRQLDAGNFSDSLFAIREDVSHDRRSAEEIGQERRHLVGLWEGLVERVRELPQFRFFLRPVPFSQLRQAAIAGRIIIINASRYGVDALVFSAAQPIGHVPLPDINIEELAILSRQILLRRPVVATEKAQRTYVVRHLEPALRIVWEAILVPIFNKLDVPSTPSTAISQSRIWWYPTGPLTFIPIHAAGPGRAVATDVSRLVISSYVTSLNSLLQAQKRHRQDTAMHSLKFLAISQPNTPNLPVLPQSIAEVDKLIKAVHVAAVRSDACSKQDIMHLDSSDATVNRVSAALDSCSWVHFACHGFQDPVLGMKSAFALHDGPLELGEIASKRLSSGQFAFLSACHAASGLKELPGEAMHLAAGLQFAGFPSVIATMWSIRDDDAPEVADQTYQHLFRNGLQGLDPSEAAAALNRAILHLREDPKVTVDQWAPFIHFGI